MRPRAPLYHPGLTPSVSPRLRTGHKYNDGITLLVIFRRKTPTNDFFISHYSLVDPFAENALVISHYHYFVSLDFISH